MDKAVATASAPEKSATPEAPSTSAKPTTTTTQATSSATTSAKPTAIDTEKHVVDDGLGIHGATDRLIEHSAKAKAKCNCLQEDDLKDAVYDLKMKLNKVTMKEGVYGENQNH